MITADSRYAQSKVATITDLNSGQDRATIVSSVQEPYSFSFNTYLVKDFDRIDNLAYQFFGDATKWWQIADANPQILDWASVPAGTLIRIPFL